MKTIIHITLSDLERNDLAKRIDRDPNTKRLVTRKEVTEYTAELLATEIIDGREQEEEGEVRTGPVGGYVDVRGAAASTGDSVDGGFVPSRGDEDYLTQPKDADIAAACSRILDDSTLIQAFAWDTIERNSK